MLRTAIAARSGLTISDAECLDFLLDTGSATAGQLAERTHLTTGAITGMIRRLEAAGYVTSQRDPADRRRVIIRAVPDRFAEIAADYADFQRGGRQILESYTIDELRFLADHYRRMSELYTNRLSALRAPSALGD